jgi:hypothetical protein
LISSVYLNGSANQPKGNQRCGEKLSHGRLCIPRLNPAAISVIAQADPVLQLFAQILLGKFPKEAIGGASDPVTLSVPPDRHSHSKCCGPEVGARTLASCTTASTFQVPLGGVTGVVHSDRALVDVVLTKLASLTMVGLTLLTVFGVQDCVFPAACGGSVHKDRLRVSLSETIISLQQAPAVPPPPQLFAGLFPVVNDINSTWFSWVAASVQGLPVKAKIETPST